MAATKETTKAEKETVKKPMNLKEKLMHIQCELKVEKSRLNDFGGYMYRSAEDIYNGVKPYLSTYKCVLLLTDDILEISGKAYIKSTAMLSDVESDEQISVSGYAQESEHGKMTGDQWTFTASSYARKNALNALLLLTGSEEQEQGKINNVTADKAVKPKKKVPVCESCGQVIEIPRGWTMAKMLAYFKKENNGKVECKECRERK